MAQDLGPPSLVALMTYIFSGKQGRAPRCSDPRYGIGADCDTDWRTSAVLDAMAHLHLESDLSGCSYCHSAELGYPRNTPDSG